MKFFFSKSPTGLLILSAAFSILSTGCTQVQFQDIPVAVVPPPKVGAISSSPSQLGNADVQTTLNSPIDFNAQLTFNNGKSFQLAVDTDGSLTIQTKYGTLEIVPGETLKFRYTPGTNFRGEDKATVYLIQDGKVVSTATIRIRVSNPLVDLKPALVVRGTGCIMCHASLNSNVITDFGYGDAWFWGGPGAAPEDHTSIYADESTDPAWRFVKTLGPQVFVPQASTQHLPKVGAASLASYLQNIISNSPAAAVRGSKVVEMKSIYIGAPTADRIRKIGSLHQGELIRYFPDANQPDTLPALRQVKGVGTDYWTNDQAIPLVCSGDLIIDGVLVLIKPVITSQTGCRIYSTKSVFSYGPITYSGGDPVNQNLQIASARSINLGLGKNTCNAAGIGTNSLLNRLQSDDRRKFYFTRGEPTKTVQEKLNDIVADAALMDIAQMSDAACEPVNGRNVGFNHIILNAPIVFSRYQGDFRGSIIAEIALMSLGAFVFEFDPVFSSQVILPLLDPSDYLAVE